MPLKTAWTPNLTVNYEKLLFLDWGVADFIKQSVQYLITGSFVIYNYFRVLHLTLVFCVFVKTCGYR